MITNGVEVQIISEDGNIIYQELLPDEIATIESLDRTLKADLGFQSAYPNAKLVRIDSSRGVQDSDAGRYYLRYQHDNGVTEFWGHRENKAYVDCEQGLVGVAE